MTNEVKFWKYGVGELDDVQAEITLEDTIKFYVNYQLLGPDQEQLNEREQLKEAIDIANIKNTPQFFNLITNVAEALSEEELSTRLAGILSLEPPGVPQEWPADKMSAKFQEYVNSNMETSIPHNVSEFEKILFKE